MSRQKRFWKLFSFCEDTVVGRKFENLSLGKGFHIFKLLLLVMYYADTVSAWSTTTPTPYICLLIWSPGGVFDLKKCRKSRDTVPLSSRSFFLSLSLCVLWNILAENRNNRNRTIVPFAVILSQSLWPYKWHHTIMVPT